MKVSKAIILALVSALFSAGISAYLTASFFHREQTIGISWVLNNEANHLLRDLEPTGENQPENMQSRLEAHLNGKVMLLDDCAQLPGEAGETTRATLRSIASYRVKHPFTCKNTEVNQIVHTILLKYQ